MIAERLTAMRPLPLRALRARLPRPTPRALALAALALVLLGGGWLWLRDSSLVAVRHVDIAGLRAEDPPSLRAALRDAARDMTTLHIRLGRLRAAAAPYPVVRDVRVRRDLPHRLVIEVVERAPVGAVTAGGRRVAVAADGTVLTGTPAAGPLAAIPGAPPGGPRVSDPRTVRAVDLLAAAPAPLRTRVERVAEGRRGIVAWLRDGPLLIFGSHDLLAAKWTAAAAVLADAKSAGATYVDLRYPDRPAAGGVGDPQEGMEEEQALAGTPPADEQAAPSANPPAAPPPDAQP